MKKKIEAELISLAHRILQLKDNDSLERLHQETRRLYEVLTMLRFAEEHFQGAQPTIGQIHQWLDRKEPELPKVAAPQALDFVASKAVSNSIVPAEFVIDQVNASISEDLFVPVEQEESHVPKAEPERPKSLNDRLKKNINIGLNDRLAFIKHLFDGSSADYNRVLSQLNTVSDAEEALNFLNTMVKPDYHFWEGKEVYEERFIKLIGLRFDQ